MQRGALGAQNLNELLQAALNPKQLGVDEHVRGQKTLRVGDRVIQMVNNYDLEVFNGDIGYLRFIDREEKQLTIQYPEREVTYTFEQADELQLAYALTVHKSQGSEYPAVVIAPAHPALYDAPAQPALHRPHPRAEAGAVHRQQARSGHRRTQPAEGGRGLRG